MDMQQQGFASSISSDASMNSSFDLPTTTASTSASRPYAKGQRSATACDTCHARKTRCSGEIPCAFCQSRSIPCVVSDSATRSANTKRPRLSSTPSNVTPGPTSRAPQQPIPYVASHQTINLLPPIDKSLFSPPSRNPVPLSSILGGTSNQLAVGPSPPLQLDGVTHRLETYQQSFPVRQGPNLSPSGASNISVADSNVAPQDTEHSVSGIILTRYQRPPAKISEPSIPQLLDRRSSAKYFDAYFSEAEWLYQLFPLPQYISAYHEAVWAAEDGSLPHALTAAPVGMSSILAALLALGALFERKVEDSERLYRAARQSYLDIIDLATLESIQLALQLAVFEINTSRSKSVWSSLAVAVRLSHYLNLHRKPALAGRSPEESLRRCQLWYNCFVHDCWLSLSSGRPALAADGDSDLDAPWLPPSPGHFRLASSPIFGMRVRLSAIWTNVHDQLYRRRATSAADVPWIQRLPALENDFQVWAQDMHNMSTSVVTNRPDKKQMQAILLAQALMRLIMHRSFLIQRGQLDSQQALTRQRQISEAAVLDGALTVIDTCKRLVQLGIHLSFWFLTVDLQIACLALCEYLQNQHDKPTGTDISKPEEGLRVATGVLQEIADSGENAAVGQVLEAVKAIQDAWNYQTMQLNQQAMFSHQVQHNTALQNQQTQSLPVDPTNLLPDQSLAFTNGNAGMDFFGAPLADLDWLNNFGAGGNIFDGFVASPAPAAENLAWWIAPRGAEP